MANIGTRLYTWIKGEFVGDDEAGNRYYRERGHDHDRWERRWVIYNGEALSDAGSRHTAMFAGGCPTEPGAPEKARPIAP